MVDTILALTGIIGVINGLFLSLYLLFISAKDEPPNKYLALLLLALTIRVFKSIISSIISVNFLIINIGLAAFTCAGPFLYLYLKRSADPKEKFKFYYLLHFIPAVLIILCTFAPFSGSDPIWDIRYNMIMLQILAYLIISVIYYLKEIKGNKNLFFGNKWYLFLLAANIIIWLAYGLTWWLGVLPYLSGALLFCFVIYILIFLRLSRKKIEKTAERYKNSILSKEESGLLFQKLLVYVKDEKPYFDSNVTIAKLAASLEIKPHVLSQVINENLNVNFFEFINSYRIEEVKTRFQSGEYSKHTIAAIAYECGFNSISSFNSAFKKFTKESPNKYRSKLIV